MRLPSPALVISLVALFVALGGTSYAVTQLPKNSVGTQQLKKNAVTSPKIKDGTIAAADLSAAARAALTGPKGEKGDTGAAGPRGIGGFASAYAYSSTTVTITSNTSVVSLGQGAKSSGPVTVTERSRLAITATVSLSYGGGTTLVICESRVRNGGQTVPLDAPDTDSWETLTNPGSASPYAIPVANSATVDAGTYDVGIICTTYGTGTATNFRSYLRVDVMPA